MINTGREGAFDLFCAFPIMSHMYENESPQEYYSEEEERYSQTSLEDQDFQRYRDYVMYEEPNYDAEVHYIQDAPDFYTIITPPPHRRNWPSKERLAGIASSVRVTTTGGQIVQTIMNRRNMTPQSITPTRFANTATAVLIVTISNLNCLIEIPISLASAQSNTNANCYSRILMRLCCASEMRG